MISKIIISFCSIVIIVFSSFSQKVTSDSVIIGKLEEVTIIGNKAKTLPGAGQYIGLGLIKQLNESNINNVLRIIPGVNIRDEEGFGLRPNIGLRGTPVNRSAKITLMEDGILIAPAPYADPSAYYFPTFARMQGVEVLKGSSQIKYGPYTIGGAVNLLSTAIPNSLKAFAQLSYGSFKTNQQRVWLGDSNKNFDYVFDINRLASNGFKQIDNGGNTGFERKDIMGKLRWHTAEKAKIQQSITLKLLKCNEDGNETYLGLTYDDYLKNPLRRYAGTKKDVLILKNEHASLNYAIAPLKNLSFNVTAYHSKTGRDWARANTFGGQSINNTLTNSTAAQQNAYNIMIGKANGSIDYQSAARNYISRGVQLNSKYEFKTKYIVHKLHIGLRLHQDEADRIATKSIYTMKEGVMSLATEGIAGNQENQIRSAKSIATFISYDILFKKLTISPGLRHENINLKLENFGNNDKVRAGTILKTAQNKLYITLPGIGLNYEFNRISSLFGGIHKGFSPPGMPSTSTNNVQAKSESSINYEIGYRFEKQNLNIQATAFLNNYDNILGSDNVSGGGAGTGDVFNAGNAKIKGVEMSVNYNLLAKTNTNLKLPFNIAYTYTSAKFQETFVNGGGDWGTGNIKKGDLIPFITPHTVTTSISLQNKKFDVTIIGRYTGQTRVKPGQGNGIVPAKDVNFENVNSLKQFLILDISANYNINKTITVFSLLNNLTNNKAIVANLPQSYRPNMPLSFNAGLKANF